MSVRSARLRRLRERTLCLVRKEVVDLAGRAVVGDDGEALVVHVEDQVLTLEEMGLSTMDGKGKEKY